MPKSTIKQELELKTRNDYTKVNCEVTITVDGRELPSLEVLGKSLESGIELIQTSITDSYKAVPERVG